MVNPAIVYVDPVKHESDLAEKASSAAAFNYRPSPLNPATPYIGRAMKWRGDSIGVPDNSQGIPLEVMHSTLVAKRLNATSSTIQHVGGSIASDVVLRMIRSTSPQWQDERNPGYIAPTDIAVLNVGTNDGAMGGFLVGPSDARRPASLRQYADSLEAYCGLVQSQTALSSWTLTGAWEDLVWSERAPGPTNPGSGTAKRTTAQGAKASQEFSVDIGRGATAMLLAPVDSTGSNYVARIRRASEPASAARIIKTDTTIDHGYGGAGSQLGAPYSPVPITWRDTASEFPIGTRMVLEIENTAAAPLIVVSLHPWGGTPDVRIAPPQLLSDEAFRLLARDPDPAYRSSNAVIKQYYRPALSSLVAAFNNGRIKAIRTDLYDALFPYLALWLRIADRVHPNPAGQKLIAQAVYEGILGVVDGYNPDDFAFLQGSDVAGLQTAIEGKADTAAVTSQITALNGVLASKADSSTVENQITAINTALGSKADTSAVTNQITALNTAIGSKADTSAVTSQVNAINTALASKADSTTVTQQITDLNAAITARPTATTVNAQVKTVADRIDALATPSSTAIRDGLIAVTADPAIFSSTYTLNASATMVHRVAVESATAITKVRAYLTVYDTTTTIQAAVATSAGVILAQSAFVAGAGASNWYSWDLTSTVAAQPAGTILYVVFTRSSAAGTATFRATTSSTMIAVPTAPFVRAAVQSTAGAMPSPVAPASMLALNQVCLVGIS